MTGQNCKIITITWFPIQISNRKGWVFMKVQEKSGMIAATSKY